MENKKELRKKILKLRNSLTEEELQKKSELIYNKFVKSKEFVENQNILIYINYQSEVITKKIISYGLLSGKTIACPKVLEDGKMHFFEIHGFIEVEKGYKGIYEPVNSTVFEPEEALVVVPGVVFDRDGFRIGYGKGFYDRYLRKHKAYKTVGLAFKEQIIDNIPAEEHDVKIMNIITE